LTPAWAELATLAATPPDPAQDGRYVVNAAGWQVNFSYQRINDQVLDRLLALMDQVDLRAAIDAMFRGDLINTTEQRAALHVALRQQPGDAIGSADIEQAVLTERERMLAFAEDVRNGGRYDTVINIGIGGSDLGPAMAVAALKAFTSGAPKVHFVSNVDGCALADLLEIIDPARTLFVICSKTFTTQETMANAETARRWLIDRLGESAIKDHFAAVSVNAKAMDAFGIDPAKRFQMWDWVGGRYSVWSSIGLSLAIAIGRDGFLKFLAGAREVDRHFVATPWRQNLPALLAAVGIWNINFLKIPTLAVLPYTDRLARLPAYLQQLEMESNGKSVTHDGEPVGCETAPVIWGEPGNNAQHSFFQLLHQGTLRTNLDILLIQESPCGNADQQRLANANARAQIEAFTSGQTTDDPHRCYTGMRPLTVLRAQRLDPETVGALLALYEHKTYVQSVIWGINAFDQFGVELGKKLCQTLLIQSVSPQGSSLS
jgi:glucose-6-phosphate isomerase